MALAYSGVAANLLSVKSHVASVRALECIQDELNVSVRAAVLDYETQFCAMRKRCNRLRELAVEETRLQSAVESVQPARSRGLGFNRESALRELLLQFRVEPHTLGIVLAHSELDPPTLSVAKLGEAEKSSKNNELAAAVLPQRFPSSFTASISSFLSSSPSTLVGASSPKTFSLFSPSSSSASPASPSSSSSSSRSLTQGASSSTSVVSTSGAPSSSYSLPSAAIVPVALAPSLSSSSVSSLSSIASRKETDSLASSIVFDVYCTEHGTPEDILRAERACLVMLKQVLLSRQEDVLHHSSFVMKLIRRVLYKFALPTLHRYIGKVVQAVAEDDQLDLRLGAEDQDPRDGSLIVKQLTMFVRQIMDSVLLSDPPFVIRYLAHLLLQLPLSSQSSSPRSENSNESSSSSSKNDSISEGGESGESNEESSTKESGRSNSESSESKDSGNGKDGGNNSDNSSSKEDSSKESSSNGENDSSNESSRDSSVSASASTASDFYLSTIAGSSHSPALRRVSELFFLTWIVNGLSAPHLYGLIEGIPLSQRQHANLQSLSNVLLKLMNGSRFTAFKQENSTLNAYLDELDAPVTAFLQRLPSAHLEQHYEGLTLYSSPSASAATSSASPFAAAASSSASAVLTFSPTPPLCLLYNDLITICRLMNSVPPSVTALFPSVDLSSLAQPPEPGDKYWYVMLEAGIPEISELPPVSERVPPAISSVVEVVSLEVLVGRSSSDLPSLLAQAAQEARWEGRAAQAMFIQQLARYVDGVKSDLWMEGLLEYEKQLEKREELLQTRPIQLVRAKGLLSSRMDLVRTTQNATTNSFTKLQIRRLLNITQPRIRDLRKLLVKKRMQGEEAGKRCSTLRLEVEDVLVCDNCLQTLETRRKLVKSFLNKYAVDTGPPLSGALGPPLELSLPLVAETVTDYVVAMAHNELHISCHAAELQWAMHLDRLNNQFPDFASFSRFVNPSEESGLVVSAEDVALAAAELAQLRIVPSVLQKVQCLLRCREILYSILRCSECLHFEPLSSQAFYPPTLSTPLSETGGLSSPPPLVSISPNSLNLSSETGENVSSDITNDDLFSPSSSCASASSNVSNDTSSNGEVDNVASKEMESSVLPASSEQSTSDSAEENDSLNIQSQALEEVSMEATNAPSFTQEAAASPSSSSSPTIHVSPPETELVTTHDSATTSKPNLSALTIPSAAPLLIPPLSPGHTTVLPRSQESKVYAGVVAEIHQSLFNSLPPIESTPSSPVTLHVTADQLDVKHAVPEGKIRKPRSHGTVEDFMSLCSYVLMRGKVPGLLSSLQFIRMVYPGSMDLKVFVDTWVAVNLLRKMQKES